MLLLDVSKEAAVSGNFELISGRDAGAARRCRSGAAGADPAYGAASPAGPSPLMLRMMAWSICACRTATLQQRWESEDRRLRDSPSVHQSDGGGMGLTGRQELNEGLLTLTDHQAHAAARGAPCCGAGVGGLEYCGGRA